MIYFLLYRDFGFRFIAFEFHLFTQIKFIFLSFWHISLIFYKYNNNDKNFSHRNLINNFSSMQLIFLRIIKLSNKMTKKTKLFWFGLFFHKIFILVTKIKLFYVLMIKSWSRDLNTFNKSWTSCLEEQK